MQAMAEAGCSMSEILALLESQVTRTHAFAALDTLEFLRRSGRMSFAISLTKAGKSMGQREVTRLPSTTTSLSS